MSNRSRIVCQFSCGAASAVTTKLALAQYRDTHEVLIVNAFLKNEHADNRRFADDCERWFGHPITVLRDTKYGADIVQVFRRRGYMKGPNGAPCSKTLKRDLLDSVKRPDDVIVFGYTMEEEDRYQDFQERNPGMLIAAPLIDRALGKEDCKELVRRAGIALPFTYLKGYDNANCIGCVKGGEGYWRAIREDFPEEFEELATVQEEIGEGANFLRYRSGPLKDQRFSLRQLPPGKPYRNEKLPGCSFFCELAQMEYAA